MNEPILKGISPLKINIQFFGEELEGGGALEGVVTSLNSLADTGESGTALDDLQTNSTGDGGNLATEGVTDEPSEDSVATDKDGLEPNAKALQSKEDNAHYANIRRKAEAEAEAKAMQKLDDEIAKVYSGYTMALSGKPILSASDLEEAKRQQEFADSFLNKDGLAVNEPEKIGAAYEKIRENILKSDPEVLKAKNQLKILQEENDRKIFNDNLNEIKKAFPDEEAKSIDELGEEFFTMVGLGGLSPLEAYKTLRERKGATKAPPSMGDIAAVSAKKEFFTKDDVERMSQKQVDENFDKILKSMEKWK